MKSRSFVHFLACWTSKNLSRHFNKRGSRIADLCSSKEKRRKSANPRVEHQHVKMSGVGPLCTHALSIQLLPKRSDPPLLVCWTRLLTHDQVSTPASEAQEIREFLKLKCCGSDEVPFQVDQTLLLMRQILCASVSGQKQILKSVEHREL